MKKFLLACLLAIILSALPLVILADANTQIIDETGGKSLKEGYGVYTGVTIYNLYAGWSGTADLTIINGRDQERQFYIWLAEPDEVTPGYQPLPKECYSWVELGSDMASASAGEDVKVPVTITIPSDITYKNRHDHLAIQVGDITDGFIKIQYQSDWYLTTDPYIPIAKSNIVLIIIIAVASVGGGCGAVLLVKKRKHANR